MSRTNAFRIEKSSTLGAALLAFLFAVSGTTGANAKPLLPEEIDTAIEYIEDGLAPFQTANSIQGVLEFLNLANGVSLADKLDQVEVRLIQEIQFWVDVQRDAATTAAFRKYDEILRNPGQTTLNRERITFLTASSSSNDAGDVYAELERLVIDNGDLERSMQLTMPLNALTVMMAQAMVFHDRYFPEETPFSWWSFNDHYGRTYWANYTLVKAGRIMCHPGYNPELGDMIVDYDNAFETSRLYKKRENKRFVVGTCTCGHLPERLVHYNPVTNRLDTHCTGSETNVNIEGARFPFMNASAVAAARARARHLAQREFRTADDVAGVRDAIQNIRFMSGGDEANGIEGDLDEGEFIDPWVGERELCGASNPWAYVQRP